MSDDILQDLRRRVLETNAKDDAAVLALAKALERASAFKLEGKSRSLAGKTPPIGRYWVQVDDTWAEEKRGRLCYTFETTCVFPAPTVIHIPDEVQGAYPEMAEWVDHHTANVGDRISFTFWDRFGNEQRLDEFGSACGGPKWSQPSESNKVRGAVVAINATEALTRLGQGVTKIVPTRVVHREARRVVEKVAREGHAFTVERMIALVENERLFRGEPPDGRPVAARSPAGHVSWREREHAVDHGPRCRHCGRGMIYTAQEGGWYQHADDASPECRPVPQEAP